MPLVYVRHIFIRNQEHDDISRLGGFGCCNYLEPSASAFCQSGSSLSSRRYLEPAILQVLRLGVALAAVPDDGDCFNPSKIQVRVLIIVNLWH